jgi:hypothetical protein
LAPILINFSRNVVSVQPRIGLGSTSCPRTHDLPAGRPVAPSPTSGLYGGVQGPGQGTGAGPPLASGRHPLAGLTPADTR